MISQAQYDPCLATDARAKRGLEVCPRPSFEYVVEAEVGAHVPVICPWLLLLYCVASTGEERFGLHVKENQGAITLLRAGQ